MSSFDSGGGLHFTDPWQFLPRVAASANLQIEENDATARTSATVAFFTAMAARGAQDTTNWTADTYKTLVNIASGKGLVAALVGPQAGGAETTTFEFTVDGVGPIEIPVSVTSGQRAFLSVSSFSAVSFTTAAHFAVQGGTMNAGKTTLGDPSGGGVEPYLGGWPLITGMGTPCLEFGNSLLIRIKHSANITNSTATAYSGVQYRVGL